ncbi:PAS domain-containing protein [Alishewanella tabrizica]|uniref:histidine kinase n=1 Tax=Alishewanella tabrizica TaxID=671278 RepID=A0ABQ2WNH0_9ALTE|nr:PAS domain-containing protein [Alishewanella tabrizica]GGW62221.1 hypothetical protein GCM10008111_17670 [Alishewanella tabrizica]
MPKLINVIQQHRFTAPLLLSSVLIVFFADSQTPLGFSHGMLYMPLVVLAGLTLRPSLLHLTGVLAICAVWLGYVISPSTPAEFAIRYVLTNRSLATLALVLLWWLAAQAIKAQLQQAQQHTEEQLAKLDLTLANQVAALSHWLLDDHRKMITLDAGSRKLLNIPSAELTLEQFICCFDDHVQFKLKQQLQECLRQQHSMAIEVQLHPESGQHIWVKLVAYPDPAHPELVRGLLQNVQQSYQKAHLLAEQQLRFKQLADSLPVKVWTATAEGIVDFASNTFAEYSGIDTETILADWLAIIHPDDRADTVAMWQHCVQTQLAYKIEFRLLNAAGDYCWHLTSALPIKNEQGKVMYWFGSAMDISEQKALWQQTDHLKHTLYQTLEGISDGFFILDAHFRFTYLNQTALELLSSLKHPRPGKLLTDVFFASGKDFSPITTAIQRAFYKQHTEHLCFTLPGTTVLLYFSIYPAEQGVSILMQPQQTQLKMTAVPLP